MRDVAGFLRRLDDMIERAGTWRVALAAGGVALAIVAISLAAQPPY